MTKHRLSITSEYGWQIARIALMADVYLVGRVAIGFEAALYELLDGLVAEAYREETYGYPERFVEFAKQLRKYADYIEEGIQSGVTEDESAE
jgi:hypothetical protein